MGVWLTLDSRMVLVRLVLRAAQQRLAMLVPGVGIKPEAILHRRFRSLAAELEASSDAAGPGAAGAAADHAGAPATSAPAADAAPDDAPAPMAAAEPSAPASEAPTPMAVDAAGAAPAEAAAPAQAQQAAAGSGREEQQQHILDHTLNEVVFSSRPEARSRSACVQGFSWGLYTELLGAQGLRASPQCCFCPANCA